MRRSILFGLVVLLFGLVGRAQESQPPRAAAYAFFAPGAAGTAGNWSKTLQFGGGGEGLIYKGLGAGADIGYLFPAASFKDGFGLLSTNGTYHFNIRSSPKLVPFVTAGYSMAFRDGHANLANFGGGVDYWFSNRAALRLEVRDHVWPGDYDPATHFLMFRIGVVGR